MKLLISGDRKRRRSVLLIWDVREGDSLNTIAPCKEILKYNWFLVYLFQNAKKNRNLFLFFFFVFWILLPKRNSLLRVKFVAKTSLSPAHSWTPQLLPISTRSRHLPSQINSICFQSRYFSFHFLFPIIHIRHVLETTY